MRLVRGVGAPKRYSAALKIFAKIDWKDTSKNPTHSRRASLRFCLIQNFAPAAERTREAAQFFDLEKS